MTARSIPGSLLSGFAGAVDRIWWWAKRKSINRKLMNYTSKANKPLFDMLNQLFERYGFESAPQDAPARPDIARWQKALGPTIKAQILVNLNPGSPPDTWSLEPVVLVDSTYVALWHNKLRLYRDFHPTDSSYREAPYRQALRFFPAHIRWQERMDLQMPTLDGRLETIDSLREAFADVCEHYIMPVLEQLGEPMALAEFQLRAATEYPATRISWGEPRYKVSSPYISTALLLDEAGDTARAAAYLEQVCEELSRVRTANDGPGPTRLRGQLNRLLEHLRNKTP